MAKRKTKFNWSRSGHGGEETPTFFLSRMVAENGCYSSLLNGDGPHQISPSKPMHPEGGSLFDFLVGVHARVLATSCRFFFYNDFGHHINNILVGVDLSYLEQLFFNSFHDPMIYHIYVLRPFMIHSVLAYVYRTLTIAMYCVVFLF